MILLHFFSPGYGVYAFIAFMLILMYYKRNALLMLLLNIILLPFAIIFVILFSLVGYTPKWLKDDKSKDDDTPPKHRNIIF